MVDLNDATRPPNPNGGWSTEIRTVPDAVIAPIEKGYLVHDAGVYDADQNFVHEGVLWRGRPLLVPAVMPEVVDHLPGRWIWGGLLVTHFGHFLTESTGRLWALDELKGKIDGIIFIAKHNFPQEVLEGQNFHKLFLDFMGVDVPVRIVTTPTRVDVLEVPGQGFGIGYLIGGTEKFRNFVRNRFAREVKPDGPERLYLSRSALTLKRGGILEEARLEQYLYDCGYEIFHPQDHPLDVQVARYKAARHVVSPDGSALHLLALLSHPEQHVAIIKRRETSSSIGVVRHVAGFAHNAPTVISAITHQWIRSDREFADIYSFIELDLAATGATLAEAGFVPKDINWSALTEEEATEAMRVVEGGLAHKRLTFRRVLRGQRAPLVPAEPAPPTTPRPAEHKHAKRARRAERRESRAKALE